MNKNGTYFVSVIENDQFTSTLWDPFAYRSKGSGKPLADYMAINKIASKRIPYGSPRFRPLEYRDLPGGEYLSFSLERDDNTSRRIMPAVGEGAILFGTMRAYLGNIAVTPQANWIGFEGPLYFEAKSEFVTMIPEDGLIYFWLIYLRSQQFLRLLPLGGGGTRPRLHPSTLDAVSVSVPDLQTRENVHNSIQELAQRQWETHRASVDAIQLIIRQL